MKPDEFAKAVASHRPYLLRMALNQLNDKAAAEDAVQEALLAALASASQFEQRASVKTWLISILKYKIIDAIRAKGRAAVPLRSSNIDDDEDDPFDTLFEQSGCWSEPKDVWSDPETVAERSAFFKVLEACLTKLPERTSRVFLMREWLETDPEEICKTLDLSPGNLRILLYRARMQLRACLEVTWEK